MIQKIKQELDNHKGDKITIKYNMGRNKIEEYDAKIKETYNNIFLIENEDFIKSFSYSDVITKIIKIEYK